MWEKWKPLPGFEELYEVSDQGRIKRLPRAVAVAGNMRRLSAKTVSQNAGPYGHWYVSLARGNARQVMRVADCVMVAFKGPAPAGMEAVHKDDDKANNKLGNLEYGPSRNVADYFNPGNAKLVPSMVRDIRASNWSNTTLAEVYGVTVATIRDIKAGKTWKDV